MPQVPIDTLKVILAPFQQNEHSLFIKLVCKKWNSLVKFKREVFAAVIAYYTRFGSFDSLLLMRRFIQYAYLYQSR